MAANLDLFRMHLRRQPNANTKLDLRSPIVHRDDMKLRDKLSFDSTLESVRKVLTQWKRRGLNVMGKIQVSKSPIIPKFPFRFTNISSNDEIIKENNNVMYHFIWNNQDKIKLLAIINDIENDDLKMTHLETAIQAQRIMF